MLSIEDLLGNEEPLTDFKSLKRIRRVNGESTISALFLPSKRNEHAFNLISEESTVHFEHEYIIKKIQEKSIGKKSYKQIDAVHKFYIDLINKQQPKIHNGSITFNNYMNMVFEDTGYSFVVLDAFNSRPFENLGNENRLSLLQKGLQRFKAEFELVGNEVRFQEIIGNDTDFQFRFGHNIKAISVDVDSTNLATVIRGTGDTELGVEAYYRSPNADIVGELDSPPVNDERFKSEEALLDEMKLRLQDEPEVSIQIDFVDLRAAGYPYTVPNEGDRVWVIYEPMNDLLLETRILEIEEHFDNELKVTKTNVTLSNHRRSFADTMFENVNKQLSEIINDDGIIKYDVLDQAVKLATEALQSAQTELIFDNGIIAREKTDPNKLVLFNSAGIGISSDGGQTFSTAMTGDGIVADVITAGTIRGIDIVGTNIMSYSTDNNDVITMNDGIIETFVSGGKRFGVYGDGLRAFSWVTGEEVARFRSTILNGTYGAGIMGSGSYFNIGKIDSTNDSDDNYLFFDFEERSISSWVDLFEINGNLTVNGSLGDASFRSISINNANNHSQPRYIWEYNNSNGALELSSMDSNNNWWYRMEFVGRGEGSRVQFYNNMYNEWVYASESTNAANMRVASSGRFYRSTSSKKYKKDIENLNYDFAEDIVKNLRPVWYRPKKIDTDDVKENWSHVGLISEEVATVEPRLVDFNLFDEEGDFLERPIPEGVQYPLLGVYLLPVVQKLMNEVEDLRRKLKGVI